MLTLGADEKLFGRTDGGNVVYTMFGKPSASGTPAIIAQGFFADLYALNVFVRPAEIHSVALTSVSPGYSPQVELFALRGDSDFVDSTRIIYKAQLPVGGMATYGEGKWTLYTVDGIPVEMVSSGGTLADGDYGDVTVSLSGTVITVDSGLPASRIGSGTVDNTEFGYLNGVTSNIQTQLNSKAADALVVHLAGSETITGVKTFNVDPIIPDEVYGPAWNGVAEAPTKNAVYDKVSALEADIIAMAAAL